MGRFLRHGVLAQLVIMIFGNLHDYNN